MKDTFLEELRATDTKGLSEFSARAPIERARAVLARGHADTLEDFAALISPNARPLLEDMARLSAGITKKYFGMNVRMFAPLYVSNQCVNNCVYCGFAIRNSIERKTLSFDEVRQEVAAIYDLGFRNILLVASENPKLVSSGYMDECIKIAREKMPDVSIEIAPSSVEDYRRYVASGCEGLTVFQETYDEQIYPDLHPSGPKHDFKWRLATPERGIEAGMRIVGLGALLGICDWRRDIISMALHAQYLTRKAWRTKISVSLPRMRPSAGGFKVLPENIPTDADIVQIMCALRIFLNRLSIVVSTRESRKFRDGIMGLGVTQMSAYSSTRPGGYAHPSRDGEQFCINDNRTPAEFASALRAKGLCPVWKDFDSAFA